MIVSYDARFLLIVSSFLSLFCEAGSFHHVNFVNRVRHQFKLTAHNGGLSDLLNGKSLFITGVADTKGYGWGIAKQCAAMGARVFVGTWVPMVKIFEKKLHRGDYDEERKLDDGTLFDIARVYPIDVAYDTCHDIPTDVRNSERYRDFNHYSIQEVADQIHQEHGMIDGIVHCIANAPDINKSLLQTSRAGYLAVMSISAYSFISMVSKFATIMNPGGSIVAVSYRGSQRVIPGYGGGISSAKAALEADVRYLAYEVGRKYGHRVNAISPGPLASRAGLAIDVEDGSFLKRVMEYSQDIAPLQGSTSPTNVGTIASFLLSPSSQLITGSVLFCDNGLNIM